MPTALNTVRISSGVDMSVDTSRRRLLKHVSAVTMLVTTILLLPGCMLLGDSGRGQPISMTVRGGEFVFRWCGEQTDEFRYLELGYAEYTPDRVDERVFTGTGQATLSPGDEFSIAAPPEGIVPMTIGSFPRSKNRLLIFLYTGRSESVNSQPSATFDVPSVSELEGNWAYVSGGIHDKPCEMRGAASEGG